MKEIAHRQWFAKAKMLYIEGQYEEALSILLGLAAENPDVFNIRYAILQCWQKLDRLGKVKAQYRRLQKISTTEKQQVRLKLAEKWIGEAEQKQAALEKGWEAPVSERRIVPEPVREGLSKVFKTMIVIVEVVFIIAAGLIGMHYISARLSTATPEFSADLQMEVSDASYTGRLYFKNHYISRTEIMDDVFIANNGKVDMMFPEDNAYASVDASDLLRRNPLIGLGDFKEWESNNTAEKVGRETLHGFDCDIYETRLDGSDAVITRVWYARRLNFPVKIENATPDQTARVTVALNNIETGTLPVELFVIPDAYTETDRRQRIQREANGISDLPDNMAGLWE